VLLTCRRSTDMIVLTHSLYKRNDFCSASSINGLFDIDFGQFEQPMMDNTGCFSSKLHDTELEETCNGNSACSVTVPRVHHRRSQSSNCDFTSNSQNLFFTCLPSRNFFFNNFFF
jgi:hypothetical protein